MRRGDRLAATPAGAAARSARRAWRRRAGSAAPRARPNTPPSVRSRPPRPAALSSLRKQHPDQRRDRQRDDEDHDERDQRRAPRGCGSTSGSASPSGPGEQVRGEEGEHPAGQRDDLAHQAAPDAPRDRDGQHAEHGVVEPGHPDRVVTAPGSRPSFFSCACAFSAASLLANGPARTRVSLSLMRLGVVRDFRALELRGDVFRVGEHADLEHVLDGRRFRYRLRGIAGCTCGTGFGVNEVSSSPGMRTLTLEAVGRGSGSNTIGRTMTASKHQGDGADQAAPAAALQCFDVLRFSHSVTSPTVRKDPNTTILSFSPALPSARGEGFAYGVVCCLPCPLASLFSRTSARRAARARQGSEMPARDARRQLAQHAGDVLVAQHAEDGDGFRSECRSREVVARASSPPRRCVPRRGSPAGVRAAPGSARASSTSARPAAHLLHGDRQAIAQRLERAERGRGVAQLHPAAQRRIGEPAAAPARSPIAPLALLLGVAEVAVDEQQLAPGAVQH